MFQEAQERLKHAGLEINEDKTAHLATHPASAQALPGKNANDSGMKILGRTFKISDNSTQDMDLKIASAWSKFNKLRHILRANTPLPHRLRIFKSCVGQALLWASETWHLTRRRLQRIRGVELAMMRTLIACPPLPPDTDKPTRFETHRKVIRDTLSALKYEGLDRQWARRYYSWAGHLSRLPNTRLAKQALSTKNLAWWRRQQQNPQGHRHTKRNGNLSRWENPLGRHHPKHEKWQDTAQFRDRWKLYYPTFEKRLFGPNCPHDFSNTVELGPDNQILVPPQGQATPPQRDPPGRKTPTDRKHPREGEDGVACPHRGHLDHPHEKSRVGFSASLAPTKSHRMTDGLGDPDFSDSVSEDTVQDRPRPLRKMISLTRKYLARMLAARKQQQQEELDQQELHSEKGEDLPPDGMELEEPEARQHTARINASLEENIAEDKRRHQARPLLRHRPRAHLQGRKGHGHSHCVKGKAKGKASGKAAGKSKAGSFRSTGPMLGPEAYWRLQLQKRPYAMMSGMAGKGGKQHTPIGWSQRVLPLSFSNSVKGMENPIGTGGKGKSKGKQHAHPAVATSSIATCGMSMGKGKMKSNGMIATCGTSMGKGKMTSTPVLAATCGMSMGKGKMMNREMIATCGNSMGKGKMTNREMIATCGNSMGKGKMNGTHEMIATCGNSMGKGKMNGTPEMIATCGSSMGKGKMGKNTGDNYPYPPPVHEQARHLVAHKGMSMGMSMETADGDAEQKARAMAMILQSLKGLF